MTASPSLTHDELKAAEAAFRGLPRNPQWSERAQAVYDGIIGTTQGRNIVDEAAAVAVAG
ncbi:hypothetical protein [Candidatus Nitrospira bockiana]